MIAIVRQVVDGPNNMTCQQDSKTTPRFERAAREKIHVEHRLIRGVAYQALLSVNASMTSHAHDGSE
jgi:hypothetical protein